MFFSLSLHLSLSPSLSLSLSAKKLQKSCCRHSTNVQRTKPNKPCDGNKMLGTPSPYNISMSGVHPLQTSPLGIWLTRPYNFGTSGVHPLCTSVLRSSCLETYHISLFSDPPPCPPFSVLVYFSFLECLTSYRSCRSVSGFRTR